MMEQPPPPDDRVGRDAAEGMPRWVKVSGIVVAVLILIFVGLQFVGDGGHGPRRHVPFGDDPTPSSELTDHRPPPGVDHRPARG